MLLVFGGKVKMYRLKKYPYMKDDEIIIRNGLVISNVCRQFRDEYNDATKNEVYWMSYEELLETVGEELANLFWEDKEVY